MNFNLMQINILYQEVRQNILPVRCNMQMTENKINHTPVLVLWDITLCSFFKTVSNVLWETLCLHCQVWRFVSCLHGITSERTVILMLTANGTSELTKDRRYGAIYFPSSNIPICILFSLNLFFLRHRVLLSYYRICKNVQHKKITFPLHRMH